MGHRFAHPLGRYEETYGATRLVGALLEVWANDVPDEGAVFAARLVRRAAWHPPHEIGRLPSHRFDNLVVLRLTLSSSKFVDLKSVSTRTWLSRHPDMQSAAKRAGARGVRFDSGLLEGSGPPSRIVTQNIGRVVYDDGSMFSGINFRTRVGGDYDTETLQKPVLAFVYGEKGLIADVSLEGAKVTKLDR